MKWASWVLNLIRYARGLKELGFWDFPTRATDPPSCSSALNSSFLSVTEIGARRAVIQGSVPLMMNMFIDWHRTDHRHRQVAVRKAILTVLKNIIMISKLWIPLLEYCVNRVTLCFILLKEIAFQLIALSSLRFPFFLASSSFLPA